jgi:ABC-2 type transport system ATP-binding protein
LRSETGDILVSITANDPAEVARVLSEQFQMVSVIFDQQVRINSREAVLQLPAIVEATKLLASSVSVGRPSLEDVFIAKTGHKFLVS